MTTALTIRRALRVLADDYGCEPTVESIARRVYKTTECGAYFEVVGETVIIGTIVEGCDAEYSVELVLDEYDNDSGGIMGFSSDVSSALMACESFVDDVLYDDEYDDDLYAELYGDNGIDLLG